MLIEGAKVAQEIRQGLKSKILALSHLRKPTLAMVLVGEHAPSLAYVEAKKKACLEVGILSKVVALPAKISQISLLSHIQELNEDPLVDGILVQSPLPPPLHAQMVFEKIDPQKDVDGFHPLNMGKLLLSRSDGFIPCTPLGIKVLLERSHIPLLGQHVVIIGRSTIVGRPLAALLLTANATVTVTHSHTAHLSSVTRSGDIVIAALGSPHFLKADMVREGAVVIDVGINRLPDPTTAKGYRIVGDADFEALLPKCSAITPVPKGIGPMTVAMLLHNTVRSYERPL